MFALVQRSLFACPYCLCPTLRSLLVVRASSSASSYADATPCLAHQPPNAKHCSGHPPGLLAATPNPTGTTSSRSCCPSPSFLAATPSVLHSCGADGYLFCLRRLEGPKNNQVPNESLQAVSSGAYGGTNLPYQICFVPVPCVAVTKTVRETGFCFCHQDDQGSG